MPATILIVDDSRMMRGLVRSALEHDQHRVVEAGDGTEALAAIDGAPPDLVISDVNMPQMDGLALVRALRQQPQCRLTPILMLTTEAGEGMKQRGREAGATGWIVKPFDPQELRTAAAWALRLRDKARRTQEGRVS